jgi:hypothetical protein
VLSDNQRWYAAINNRIITLSYIRRCEHAKSVPDARVLGFLNTVPPNALSPDLLPREGDKGTPRAAWRSRGDRAAHAARDALRRQLRSPAQRTRASRGRRRIRSSSTSNL